MRCLTHLVVYSRSPMLEHKFKSGKLTVLMACQKTDPYLQSVA